mmetsp:Transcript_29636/g.45306  ORF Transcript_29636/g.45306 Transcript_29636/m.45306 type:complete len:83 (+) Transcript_29636:3381-3629(+)
MDRGCDRRGEAARGWGGGGDKGESEGGADADAGDGNNGGDNILFSSDTDRRGSALDAFFLFICAFLVVAIDDNEEGKHWGRS